MKTYSTLFLLLITILSSYGQFNLNPENGFELGRVEYGLTPSVGDVQAQKSLINFGFGKKLDEKSMLGLRFGYTHFDLYFKSQPNFGSFEDFENLNLINLNLFYTRRLSDTWNLGLIFSPTLSSTLEGSISSEDFVYNGIASATNRWKTTKGLDASLSFGLAFGTQFGTPRLFPFLAYSQQLSEKSRYTLGLPVSGYFYTIDAKNAVNITARPEGFFVNNPSTNSFTDGNSQTDAKLQFNAFRLALGYQIKFQNWITHFNLGYLLGSNLELVNDANDTLYDFEADGSITLNVALSFNLNKKKNEN